MIEIIDFDIGDKVIWSCLRSRQYGGHKKIEAVICDRIKHNENGERIKIRLNDGTYKWVSPGSLSRSPTE